MVAARGGNEIDHLRHRVHVGRVHVALGIGERVAGFVAAHRRRVALRDLAHAHAGQGRVAAAGPGSGTPARAAGRPRRPNPPPNRRWRGWKRWCSGAPTAPGARSRRRRRSAGCSWRGVLGCPVLLARDGGEQGAHLGFDEAQRGAVLQRRATVGGAFGVRVDGVAVEAGLGGLAGELERQLAGGDRVGQVPLAGRGKAAAGRAGAFPLQPRRVERGVEVDVQAW